MKRTLAFFILAFSAMALVSAQQGYNKMEKGHGPKENHRYRDFHGQKFEFEKASVTGNLTIVNGMIAVSSNDTAYITRGLHRFIGFIDGLKFGEDVTVEGDLFSWSDKNDVKFLTAEKLIIGEKEYDLGSPKYYKMKAYRDHRDHGSRQKMHQGQQHKRGDMSDCPCRNQHNNSH